MPFVRIDVLGIYPDRIGVLVQLAVALAPLAWTLTRRSGKTAPPLDGTQEPGE